MNEKGLNKRQSVFLAIAIISVLSVLMRHLVLSFVVPPPPPDQRTVEQLEAITEVDEKNVIPFTGSFCQNLDPDATNRLAESKLLEPYQALFIAVGISENLELAKLHFQTIIGDPDGATLPKYLALTKLAWMGLRVGDQLTITESLDAIEVLPHDDVHLCFQADVIYIRALANLPFESEQSVLDLLKLVITMNPQHVLAHVQLVSLRLRQLDNPEQSNAAFSDVVTSMTLLRKVSSARVFAVQLSESIALGSCYSANCLFIQSLLYNWSNSKEAARQSLAMFNSVCDLGGCQPELVLVASNLQKELSKE